MEKGDSLGEFPIGNKIHEYYTRTCSSGLYSCKDIAFVSGLDINTIHDALLKAHKSDKTLVIKKYKNVYYCSHRGIDYLMHHINY